MAFELEQRPHLRPYEAVILVHPDASEEEQKSLFRKNKTIIEEQFGGSVNHLDTWGKRSLANPIAKAKKAFYFHTTFTANPQAITELERTMRINDRVLRYMHVRLDDGTDLTSYVEAFKTNLVETAQREREREAKFQARRATQRGGRKDDRRGDDRRMAESSNDEGMDDEG